MRGRLLESISIQMNSGDIFDGKKISDLTAFIINKFADEHLSHDEAVEVLKRTKDIIGEYSKVKKMS